QAAQKMNRGVAELAAQFAAAQAAQKGSVTILADGHEFAAAQAAQKQQRAMDGGRRPVRCRPGSSESRWVGR
ncbi:hypothetical protein, partial [Salinicola salarius]|uniref:hypothetical protein n=1 Tax=Salinicola salarius TaxID=430457 RepID=UPI0026EC6DD1